MKAAGVSFIFFPSSRKIAISVVLIDPGAARENTRMAFLAVVVLRQSTCDSGSQPSPSVTPTVHHTPTLPPFGVLLSAEPHAGSNERRAGEGVFLKPAQGLLEQRSPLSSRCQVQLSTAPRSIVAHFYFPTTTTTTTVSVSIWPVPLPASVLTIHLDSSSTASYYELRSNNLGG